ncbi:MAG TPA: hypothetical protein VJ044_03630, partial [Candidatus Hodarchaeales archaeon]|nr:hypothetical protein [Candidatus Hodarchaeales archaeon]
MVKTTVAKVSKMSKSERLAALREKMKKTDTGGGGKGFWSPKEGRNVIRVLPPVGGMSFFFQEVGKHNFPDNRRSYCSLFTTDGEKPCPICELVDDLYADGAKSSIKLAKEIRLRRGYWMNIINRNGEDAGPLIFTPGVKIFNQIQNMINDPDYGDVTDEEEGLDLIINRAGTGLDTEYDVKAKRNYTPISEDADLAAEWLEKAKDLSWVEVSYDPEEDSELSKGHAVYILPYDRVVKEFGIDDLDVEEMAATVSGGNVEEVEDVEPRRQKAKAVVKGKVPVKDVDEDE